MQEVREMWDTAEGVRNAGKAGDLRETCGKRGVLSIFVCGEAGIN